MKIGIDASILSREDFGGTSRFLQNLLKYIPEVDKKNEYFLFVPHGLKEYEAKGYKIITVGGRKFFSSKYFFPFWLNLLLPIALRRFQPDIFFQPNLYLPLFINDKRIKFVNTIHDAIPQVSSQYRDLFYKIYSNIFLPFSIKKSRVIITVSNNSKRDIIKFYNVRPEKIYVIHEAADERFKQRKLTEGEKNELISKYNLPKNFILYIGAIDNRKNIIGILKIGDLLRRAKGDIKIVLIGKPGFGAKYLLKEIGKRDNVFYFKSMPSEDLSYIYNLAKLFLFPSLYEGFGLPPLEAMQSGLPVLASNVSSLPEVVGSGGIIHAPEDYEGFVRDIMRLLDDEDFYQRMKNEAISWVKGFSWRKTTEKLVDIFDEI